MKIAYFDCFSGVSGDMILGALGDAGLPADALNRELAKLGISGVRVAFEKVVRRGLSGTRAEVTVGGRAPEAADGGEERNLAAIEKLIKGSTLEEKIREKACLVFRRLAHAEAAVHGTGIDKIHFHEVGALDAIIDVVGAVCGLSLLGIDRVYSSPLAFGTGFVECRHGVLPVPVPAVVRLAEGCPVRYTGLEGELTTPTGAAVLTTLSHAMGHEISFVPHETGYGFGRREGEGPPNALRVVVGSSTASDGMEEVFVLETNVDDIPGQFVGHLMERCLDSGALDVFCTSVQMKKSRPGFQLTLLADRADLDRLRGLLVEESGSLGVRISRVSRFVAARSFETVSTSYGEVRVKSSSLPGGTKRVSAEYEDLARIARERGLPLRMVAEKVQNEIASMHDTSQNDRLKNNE